MDKSWFFSNKILLRILIFWKQSIILRFVYLKVTGSNEFEAAKIQYTCLFCIIIPLTLMGWAMRIW